MKRTKLSENIDVKMDVRLWAQNRSLEFYIIEPVTHTFHSTFFFIFYFEKCNLHSL